MSTARMTFHQYIAQQRAKLEKIEQTYVLRHHDLPDTYVAPDSMEYASYWEDTISILLQDGSC